MDITTFFDQLWADYVAIAPQAEVIKTTFESRGETVVNDHVAFRTLNLDPINLDRLEPHLLKLGYERYQPYQFPEKKLRAFGYIPPSDQLPRIFLSELIVEQLDASSQEILQRCASQVNESLIRKPTLFWSGRTWSPITWYEYQSLEKVSEYAAWFAAIGIRPNHFTISVNHLQQHHSVEDVLEVVESLGFSVNESGGRVKGNAEVLLEQGSTMADRQVIDFAHEEKHEVPTCYYEFAKRYPTPEGGLFQGFVAASADRIFESTDRNPRKRD